MLFFSCSGEQEKNFSDSPVVARVGDEVITAKQFREDYETGFGHLKVGKDRKSTYLNFMINERLLALEGYRQKLDDSPRVKESEKQLMNELLLEALIEKDIKSKIKVSPEEIREEMNKSKVSFKFRYWPEDNEQTARRVAAEMRKRGYADVVEDMLHGNPEKTIDAGKFESGYMSPLDVSPAILTAIENLPIGDISDPVPFQGRYFIFQVLDIRRNAITENEYKAKASSFEQIVFYRKLKTALGSYIQNLMAGKNIVTKGEAFRRLANAIQAWERLPQKPDTDFLNTVKNAGDDSSALAALRDYLDKPFVTFKDGELSTEEFLRHFNLGRFLHRNDNHNTFLEDLNFAVKIAIRDYFMTRRARREDLQDSPTVQRELKLWRDKWVYLAELDNLTEGAAGTGDSLHASAPFTRDSLMAKVLPEIETLKKRYPVTINHAVLDTITVIDFRKSRWATLQVFKAGSNRPAYPNVDPLWVQPGQPPDSLR